MGRPFHAEILSTLSGLARSVRVSKITKSYSSILWWKGNTHGMDGMGKKRVVSLQFGTYLLA